jgi:hypothetical protein
MKKILVVAFVFSVILTSFGKDNKDKPVLKFNKDGKFKIVQFTDIHFQYDSYRSDSALILMKRVIEIEKPDLVVLTGDIVCSKNTRLAWLALANIMTDAKIPWAVTLGNHDIEYELTGKEIMETISGLPYSMTINGPEDISGNGNYILKVRSSSSPETKALLYFFDSHSSFKKKSPYGTYEWMEFDQIQWYLEQSHGFTLSNSDIPFPAFAFFHIPLPEYKEVTDSHSTVGVYEETVCSPNINTGMYAAMLENGDVMGMFTGHDHDNNYIGCLYDICLAYGYVSGRQCYGKIGRGARVIELYEGERKFDTWVLKMYECDRDKDVWKRIDDVRKSYFVTYPDSFAD